MKTRIIAPVDSPGLDASVVPEKDNNGVIRQAIRLQLPKDSANRLIHSGDGIQITSPFGPHNRMIGIVRWRRDTLRGGDLLVDALVLPFHARLPPGLAVVNVVLRFERIELGKKRLMCLQVFPFVTVIEFAFIYKIEVELAGTHDLFTDRFDIGGEIPHIFQPMRNRPDAFGKAIVIVAMRAHVMCIGCRLVHAHKECAATGRAYGGRGKRMGVAHSVCREGV